MPSTQSDSRKSFRRIFLAGIALTVLVGAALLLWRDVPRLSAGQKCLD